MKNQASPFKMIELLIGHPSPARLSPPETNRHTPHAYQRTMKEFAMYPRLATLALSAVVLMTSNLVHAHEAHVHGVGKLDIALDGNTLHLHLDSPLMNLVGFEHAATSAKDRQAVQNMVKLLRNGSAVFVTTPAAQCSSTAVKLVSSALPPALLGESSGGKSAPSDTDQTSKPSKSEHADLDADYTFQCTYPERLKAIDVKLFDGFKGFVSIDVQLVTAKRQAAAKLTPKASTMAIPN